MIRWAALLLFYGYVLLLIVAGAWGLLFGDVDQWWLLGMDLSLVEDEQVQANVLTQYRFLRAIELGFGLCAFRYRHEVFEAVGFYRLFLPVMIFGVVARLVSILVDGWPHPIFLAFMGLEAAGVVAIYAATAPQRELHAQGQPA